MPDANTYIQSSQMLFCSVKFTCLQHIRQCPRLAWPDGITLTNGLGNVPVRRAGPVSDSAKSDRTSPGRRQRVVSALLRAGMLPARQSLLGREPQRTESSADRNQRTNRPRLRRWPAVYYDLLTYYVNGLGLFRTTFYFRVYTVSQNAPRYCAVASLGGTVPGDIIQGVTPEWNIFVAEFRKNAG